MKIWLDSEKVGSFSRAEGMTLHKLCEAAKVNYETFSSQYYHKNQTSLRVALPIAMLMEVSVEEIIKVDWED